MDAASNAAPTISDVGFQDLLNDPYPVYARARALGRIVNIEAANLLVITHFDDIVAIERDPETFSSVIPQSNVVRLFGSNLMRKDGDEHRTERKAIEPSLRPGTARQCWAPRIVQIVESVLSEVEQRGQADLFDAVAGPIAGRALAVLLGFEDVDWRTIARWSQAMMNGSANYANDPEVTKLALETGRQIEAAVERNRVRLTDAPDESILSSMLQAGLETSEIYGNVKVAIGGGFNEPRDALLTLTLGLLQNPDQLERVKADETLWPKAFEEAVRWISPIGMYPRRLTRDATIGDVLVRSGTQIGLSVAAANRDPGRFVNADSFDISRPKAQHLAFGSGPHYCAGTWIARLMIGQIAAPQLFSRLKNLRLSSPESISIRGWVFRGPTSLPVTWNN